jgi:ADP-heptose:LPS heptosyltransferase
MRRLRDVAEGLFLLPLLLMLAPVLGVATVACADRPAAVRGARAVLHRWGVYLVHGLRPLRTTWWAQYEYEQVWNFYRYFLMIEVNCALNPALSRRGGPSILIVKLGHFGDTLHLSPMVRALRTAHPEWSIDLLVGPWCEGLVRRFPGVDQVHTFTPRLFHLNRGGVGARSWWSEWRFLRRLAARRYTLVINTFTTEFLDLAILSAIRPEQWVGPVIPSPLFVPFGRQVTVPFDPEQYDATRLLAQLRAIGIEETDDRLTYPLDAGDERRTAAISAASGVVPPYAIFCPGSGWPGKNWSPVSFAALIDGVRDRFGLLPVLCGGPDEVALSHQVAASCRQPPVNLAGKTGWPELAVLIRDAALFVGNDSGPMHLAAAFDTPCVAFFGPTSPGKWGPRGRRQRVLRHVDHCPGCLYWHPGTDCVRDGACMKLISVADAESAVADVLGPATVPLTT